MRRPNGIGKYTPEADGFDRPKCGCVGAVATERSCSCECVPRIDSDHSEPIVNDFCCSANEIVMERNLLGFISKANRRP